MAKGYHYISYANALPCIRRTHKYRLPTVFSPDEVECILAQVDRSNPLGKRNYAILLLVTRLGLRISDVRLLRFENIDWKNKRISIHQQKTGIPLELPLLEDVGWAIIDYLQHGRPETDCPCIQEAIVRAVNKFNEQDNATYKALMRATISEALGLNGDPEEVDMLERKVEALNNKMLALVNESVSSGDGIEAHESEFMTLSQETELLKQRIAAIQESTAKDNGEQSRLEQIQAIISERESKCMEYDDSIVRQMVECIKVYPGGRLEIIFGGGYLVEESV